LAALLFPLAVPAYATCYSSSTGLKLQVPAKAPSTAPAWSASQAYTEGQLVQYNGSEYQARWWTQGNAPGSTSGEVWKLTVDASGMPQSWQANQVYYAGELTNYQNTLYKAKWWTKGEVPGTVGSAWVVGTIADPFSQVQLGGTFKTTGCNAPMGVSGNTNVTITWTVTQGAEAIAYWKHVDESHWKPVAERIEIARGTEKQGTLTYGYSYSHSQPYPPPPGTTLKTTYTGAVKALYLCTADNVCRKVVSSGTYAP
jgi:chitodextrinase